jgi:subtilisin family serine protease
LGSDKRQRSSCGGRARQRRRLHAPDLAANIWTRPEIIKQYEDEDLTSDGPVDDVHGFNVVEDNGDPMDENGHGTHCAGIIGAEGGNETGIAGVNWTVKIMPLKFMDSDGAGTTKMQSKPSITSSIANAPA